MKKGIISILLLILLLVTTIPLNITAYDTGGDTNFEDEVFSIEDTMYGRNVGISHGDSFIFNITTRLTMTDYQGNVTCGIYNVTDSDPDVLLGQTEIIQMNVVGTSSNWYTFNFTAPVFSEHLESYFIFVWGESDADGTCGVNGTDESEGIIPYKSEVYDGTFPDPIGAFNELSSSYDISLYASYEVNEKPVFESLAYDPDVIIESDTTVFFNSTITDSTNTINASVRLWYGSTLYDVAMTWIEGDNTTTGGNFSYNRTFPNPGTWNLIFYAGDGHLMEDAGPFQFDVLANTTFQISFPEYREVGDYIQSVGTIKNATGFPLNHTWVKTKIINDTYWTTAANSEMDLYVVNGYYHYIFSTSSMIPGKYYIIVNYTGGATEFSSNWTLYLSDSSGPGHFATPVYFNFYHATKGTGLLSNLFKIYVSDDTTIDENDRIYGNFYNTYTGDTIYYRIDDYFDNKVYPTGSSYQTYVISEVNDFIDIPIAWYDIAIKNLNSSIMYFTMESGNRFYNITLFPMDTIHINTLPGSYNITKFFYNPMNGTIGKTENDTLLVTSDGFYIASGFDAMVHISWYNTNEALGLPDETLKLYIDGTRQISKTFWTYVNRTINVTIKDYYNLTMYTGNHTLNSTYTFLDFGLTYHSYKFSNLNNEYYMISFLKSGGSRWFERGICPYESVEFLLPSGDYQLRIYDADNDTIYDNNSIHMVNSKLYVINGSHLELVINGQSVIVGQLLELQQELDDATRLDIVSVVYNIPSVYSIFDKKGAILGTVQICPAVVTTATTINETNITSNTTFYPLAPESSSTNGTITIIEDIMYFEGNASEIFWVAVGYGSSFTNYSYLPNNLILYGENVTVECNAEITVKRVTRYQQLKSFYWTKYTETNFYEATVPISNPLNVTIREVYVYIEFANDTLPDTSTARCYDVTNGVYLTRGENFRISGSGLDFRLISISASGVRRFDCSYYATDANPIPSFAIITVDNYDAKTHNEKNYYWTRGQYVNTDDEAFLGTLTISFSFDTYPYTISPYSVEVFDFTNSVYLTDEDFSFTGNGIIIDQSYLGTVQPNEARTFDIFFLFSSEEETGIEEQASEFLNTKIIGIPLGFLIIALLFIIAAVAIRAEREAKRKPFVGLIIVLFAFLLFFFWYGGM